MELIYAAGHDLHREVGGKPGCEVGRPELAPILRWPRPIAETPDDVVRLWQEVAATATTPAAIARFEDLLFTKREGNGLERVRRATAAYLAAVEACWPSCWNGSAGWKRRLRSAMRSFGKQSGSTPRNLPRGRPRSRVCGMSGAAFVWPCAPCWARAWTTSESGPCRRPGCFPAEALLTRSCETLPRWNRPSDGAAGGCSCCSTAGGGVGLRCGPVQPVVRVAPNPRAGAAGAGGRLRSHHPRPGPRPAAPGP